MAQAAGDVICPELKFDELRLPNELLVGPIAREPFLTLAGRGPLILVEVVLAACAVAPELKQDLQLVLLDDVDGPKGLVTINAVLQNLLRALGDHVQIVELMGQLHGRDVLGYLYLPPNGRQLLQQHGELHQEAHSITFIRLLEIISHTLAEFTDGVLAMEGIV